ncbi:hypothetical protein [Natronomonas marina]|uniref:hypothetical protein n=1 Tax=Natronomonas marina TaxID=2961939 RepID=UPI0020C93EA3|nr:hypothetical protein [Natronomonas marina]
MGDDTTTVSLKENTRDRVRRYKVAVGADTYDEALNQLLDNSDWTDYYDDE